MIWRTLAGQVVVSVGLAVAGLVAATAAAADFGTPGGALPGNVDAVTATLRQDRHDLELLISYGTSKGGSAGHLALAIRDDVSGDDIVHSANFYADRAPEHERDFHTSDLMLRIPKTEYLFGTTSSLGPKASFGLDFGEVYKRSVVGVRVFGVPAAEKRALARYFDSINDDFHRRASKTEYHDDEIRYDYLRLNCAKTIGSAFRFGAGYSDLEITGARLFSGRPVVAALNANVPTEMAIKLMQQWDARGYTMDVVMYRKYAGSPFVDPREDEKIAFKDLPNRFPSVLSRDFRRDEGEYEDEDNLFAIYLLDNLNRYRVRIDDETKRLEIDAVSSPMPYAEATALARESAGDDSRNYRQRAAFQPKGRRLGED
ncbi:MAG: hypothetical protein MUE62_10330 [Burkholderiaceae bacterium]|nr:hypothetical protein [Burkholderiaceae bacterium]